MRIYLIFCFSLLTLFAYSQKKVEAVIVDGKSGQPLPFVTVVDAGFQFGAASDVDGFFSITLPDSVTHIQLSAVGYEKKRVALSGMGKTISLFPLAIHLNEIQIKPGINPAHRIIQNATQQKWRNNPKKQTDFKCNSYSKLIASGYIADSAKYFFEGWEEQLDSNTKETLKLLDKQHIFITETATEIGFKRPNSIEEKVVATRMSGLKNPIFTLVSSQMQSFSFYEEKIVVLDNHFLSPLSNGSEKQYLFQLTDSIPLGGEDTLFVIRFQPRRGKNFDGLKGVLQIHSDGFGIQSVTAEPADTISGMDVRIHQKYEKIQDFWFPVQLNTLLILKNARIDNMPVFLDGKTYFSNIVTEAQFSKKAFKSLTVETFDKEAGKQGHVAMEKYRNQPLSSKDSLTYHVVDSIGKAEELDKKMGIFLTLARGYIPLKKVQIPLNRLMDYNGVEGVRLGFGLETSNQLSPFFSIGAYGAYGLRDKTPKYGANLNFKLPKNPKWGMSLWFKQDVIEPGLPTFNSIAANLLVMDLRRFYIRYLDLYDQFGGQLNWKPSKSLSLTASFIDYNLTRSSIPEVLSFREQRLGLEVDWWPGRTYNQIMDVVIPQGSSKPRLTSKLEYGNVTGITNWTRLGWKYGFPRLGVSAHEILTFVALEDVNNAFGRGAWKASEGTSRIMFGGIQNFEAKPPALPTHRYQLSYFFSHNFKNLLFERPKWKPELKLRYGLGISYQDLGGPVDEFYQEVGMELRKLIKVAGSYFGAGAYSGWKPGHNLSSPMFKLTYSFGF